MAWGTVVLLVGVVKFFTPQGHARRRLILTLASLAEGWVAMNNAISDLMLPVRWDIEGVDRLQREGHYPSPSAIFSFVRKFSLTIRNLSYSFA